MILWKIWFDLRVRFFVCLSLMILTVLMLIVFFPMVGTILSWLKPEIPAQEWKHLQTYASDYRFFMDEGWFREVQFVAAFAVVFTLGGVMTEQKSRAIFLTLSLPVDRRRWILYQTGLVLLLIMVISVVASFLIMLGGFVYGQTYPMTRAIAGTLMLGLLTLPWVGATLAITAFTQDKLKSALVIFCLWFITSLLEEIPSIRLWLPQHLIDSLEDASFPWRSLIVIFTIGIGGLFVAIRRFEESDY